MVKQQIQLRKPDIEQVDLTTRLHGINDILECTTKPIIYDGDTGGQPEHFQFTVRTLERLEFQLISLKIKKVLKNSLVQKLNKHDLRLRNLLIK